MPPEMAAVVLRERLEQGAATLGVQLNVDQIDTLLAYLVLIERWNRVYNLTALRQPQEMLTHHLLDSLAVVPALQRHLLPDQDKESQKLPVRPEPVEGQCESNQGLRQAQSERVGVTQKVPHLSVGARVLDVGSGAGLPGVVLAIVLPQLQVTCIDTVGKKASFIQQVAVELGLRQLRSHHARVEAWAGHAGEPLFDVVTSRAFSSLADFVNLTRRHLVPQGVWMAMKGKRPRDEEQALPHDADLFHVEQLQVPGLDAERCLLWMRAV
jgi:16S rRNA (guanine527-N7)-methyltransferase